LDPIEMGWKREDWIYPTQVGSSGGLKLIWKLTFEFHKRWRISWLAEWLPFSQDGLCSVEFIWKRFRKS